MRTPVRQRAQDASHLERELTLAHHEQLQSELAKARRETKAVRDELAAWLTGSKDEAVRQLLARTIRLETELAQWRARWNDLTALRAQLQQLDQPFLLMKYRLCEESGASLTRALNPLSYDRYPLGIRRGTANPAR